VLQRAGELYIPKAVEVEMVQHERDWRHHKPGWIVVAPVGAPHATQAARWGRVPGGCGKSLWPPPDPAAWSQSADQSHSQ
jgi:hypothetical protein